MLSARRLSFVPGFGLIGERLQHREIYLSHTHAEGGLVRASYTIAFSRG
jgi:hypothetical protein